MNHALLVTLLACLAAVISVGTTWLARGAARRMNFVAHPNPLVPSHTHAVAYMGGVGIVAAVALVTPLWIAVGESGEPSPAFVAAAILFAGIGLIDDFRPMSPAVKFLLQLIAGMAVGTLALGWLGIAWWIEIPLTAFMITTLVNAVNFTDVCDGLVGGLAAVAFLALAAVHTDSGTMIVLAGACVGFLFWNRAPASVYMGDAGSHLIGALLAVGAIEVVTIRLTVSSVMGMVAIMGVFLFELVFISLVRAYKRQSVFRGSPDHFSLRMQAGGISRNNTSLIAWGVGSVFAACGLGTIFSPAHLAWAPLLPVLTICVLAPIPLLRWNVKSTEQKPLTVEVENGLVESET
jgi:UDP-GlcNAc:undecaprenyl-phosphate GlcNAc-1-phosphate transferase